MQTGEMSVSFSLCVHASLVFVVMSISVASIEADRVYES